MTQVEDLLREVATVRDDVFGLTAFRPGQQAAIETILGGRDLLAVMPTGAGKSLCFQAPALVRPGLTLVISPLIALMKDQVDGLRARNVRAAYLASGQSSDERRAVWRDVRQGDIDLLYVSPERLRDQSFTDLIARASVWFVAVDEAHCISTWGSDFRPDYLRIPDAIRRLPERPVVAAFTATATPIVQADLIERLELEEPGRVLAGFDRPNLRFLVEYCAGPAIRMDELVRQVSRREGTGIVYSGTRKAAEEQSAFLSEHGVKALPYHAGLSSSERTEAQDAFMAGEIDVICATNAFGLGIDKPDVRFVIHTALPASPDAYYQEAGRAGRDALPADALMLACQGDRGLQEWMIDADMPNSNMLRHVYRYLRRTGERIAIENAASDLRLSTTALRVSLQMLGEAGVVELGDRVGQEQIVSVVVDSLERRHMEAFEEAIARQRKWRLDQLDAMEGYVQSGECRRAYLLRYFGDPDARPRGDARCCDRCARPDSRSAGDLVRQARATRLKKPRRISAARAALRDALIETGTVRGAANVTGQNPKKVGEIAREMVATGVLHVRDVVPPEVQEALAEACARMDAAGFDFRRPRPGYLQSAMSFCPPGTSWDHLALYLAHVRRRDALEELSDVEPEIVQREARPVQVRSSRETWRETLELYQAARSIQEISEERELTVRTVEKHLTEAVKAGELDPLRLVDPETAEIVRRAIEETPPSATPLRDIRARAMAIARRDIPYLAINAVQAQLESNAGPEDRNHLLERKERAEALRREREAAGQPWPDAWEQEYQRILDRLARLDSG